MIWLLVLIALEIAVLGVAVYVVGTRIQVETEGIARAVTKSMDEATNAVLVHGTAIRANTEETMRSSQVIEDLEVIAFYNRRTRSKYVEIPAFLSRWSYEKNKFKRRRADAGEGKEKAIDEVEKRS